MAQQIGELVVKVSLKGMDKVQKDLAKLKDQTGKKVPDSLKLLTRDLNRTAFALNSLARPLNKVGIAVTGVFGVAFAQARKQLPEVDRELKALQNSFGEISKTLATAALPSLQQATGIVSDLSKILRNVNPQVLQTWLNIGAISLALSTLIRLLASLTKGFSGLLTLFGVTSFGKVALVATGILAIAFAIDKVSKAVSGLFKFPSPPAWLVALMGGGIPSLVAPAAQNLAQRFFPQTGPGSPSDISDNLGKIRESFTSSFRSMQRAAEDFARTVGGALETALGDTVFDAITGRIKGLRSVLIQFANDIGREFSRLGASVLLGGLFGTGQVSEGKNTSKGLLRGGGFGGFRKAFTGIKRTLGLGGQGPGAAPTAPSAPGGDDGGDVAGKFGALAQNMDRFAAAKDRVIGNLNTFSQSLQTASGAAGSSGGQVGGVSPEAVQSVGTLEQAYGRVVDKVKMIGTAFSQVMDDNVDEFTKSSAKVVAIGTAFTALAVVISGAAAITLAALWAPAALFASVATFGVAAKVGSSALRQAGLTLGPTVAGSFAQAASGASSGGAGIGLGKGGVEGLQEGGVVRKPTLAMIGEAGPEAVIPLNKAGSMGTNITINSDFIFADDPSSVDKFVRSITDGIKRASSRRTGGLAISL